MDDTLSLRVVGSGAVVRDCVAKLRFFCKRDAYMGYDAVGQQYESEPNQLQIPLLYAMNSAMRARSSRAAWEPFLDQSLPELEAIPVGTDLIESSNDDYCVARKAMRAHYVCSLSLG